jgi:hypothetical protein
MQNVTSIKIKFQTDLVQVFCDQIAKADRAQFGVILKIIYALNAGGVLTDAAAEALQTAVDRRRAS